MVSFCQERGDLLTITLQVQPRGRKTEIVGVHDEVLKVKVAAPPVDGAANEELLRFFSEFLDVPKSRIALKQGAQSRRKVIQVSGVSTADLTDLLLKHGLLTIKLG
jgi:uncharacterized protein (TIGR00251 family)